MSDLIILPLIARDGDNLILCQDTVLEMQHQLDVLSLPSATLVAFVGTTNTGTSTIANSVASFAECAVNNRTPGQQFSVAKPSHHTIDGPELVWVHPSPVVTSSGNAFFVLDTVSLPNASHPMAIKLLSLLNCICGAVVTSCRSTFVSQQFTENMAPATSRTQSLTTNVKALMSCAAPPALGVWIITSLNGVSMRVHGGVVPCTKEEMLEHFFTGGKFPHAAGRQTMGDFYERKQLFVSVRPDTPVAEGFNGVLPREVVHNLVAGSPLEESMTSNVRELMDMMDHVREDTPQKFLARDTLSQRLETIIRAIRTKKQTSDVSPPTKKEEEEETVKEVNVGKPMRKSFVTKAATMCVGQTKEAAAMEQNRSKFPQFLKQPVVKPVVEETVKEEEVIVEEEEEEEEFEEEGTFSVASSSTSSPLSSSRDSAAASSSSSPGPLQASTADNFYLVGDGNTVSSTDVGLLVEYYEDSTTKYGGLFRDASDSGRFKLFKGSTQSGLPTATTVDTSGNGYSTADLTINTLNSISIVNSTSVTTGTVNCDTLSRGSGDIVLGTNLDGQTNSVSGDFSTVCVGPDTEKPGALTVTTNSQFVNNPVISGKGLFCRSQGSSVGDYGGYMYFGQSRLSNRAAAGLVTRHVAGTWTQDWYDLDVFTKPNNLYDADLIRTATFTHDGDIDVNRNVVSSAMTFHSSTTQTGNVLHRRSNDLHWGNRAINKSPSMFLLTQQQWQAYNSTFRLGNDMYLDRLYLCITGVTSGEIYVTCEYTQLVMETNITTDKTYVVEEYFSAGDMVAIESTVPFQLTFYCIA